jgi:hypothetical protein
MSVKKSVIIPAILALGAAGSILTGSAASVAAAQAPTVHVVAATSSAGPNFHYHG